MVKKIKQSRKWYKSKTLIFNTSMALLMIIQYLTQKYIVDMELQGLILALANLYLRSKATMPLGR